MSSHSEPPNLTANLLARTGNEILVDSPGIEAARYPGLALRAALRTKEEYVRSVLNDSSFGKLRGGWVSFAGAGHALDPDVLPNVLLARVLRGESAEHAIAVARAFSKDGSSAAFWYGALAGVTVAAPCTLAEGLDIIPWTAVPSGAQKSWLDDKRERAFAAPLRPTANCAIRIALPRRPALFQTAMEDGAMANMSDQPWFRAFERATDAIRCMTIVSAQPVAILASWAEPTENILQDFVGTSTQSYPDLSNPAVFGSSLTAAPLDEIATADTFLRFSDFSGADRAALCTAIDRIGAALRWKTEVDKAIDLGIALEVLLLHDLDDPGELTYRIGLRGAQFLGGDTAARLSNFRRLKKIYALRSKAVHKGTVEADEKAASTLEDAVAISKAITRKLIANGRFPEWEREVVLSSGASDIIAPG